jgi:hypothetical protein
MAPTRHLERVDWSPSPFAPPNLSAWPFTIPAVAQLVEAGGLEIPNGITFLVGAARWWSRPTRPCSFRYPAPR